MSDDPHAGRSRPARTDYPANWETDVVLRDGRPCHVRPIHTDDGAALQTFYDGLSEQSLYTRFFTASAELAARDVERLTQIDYSRRVALLAALRGQIIGMGVYDAAEGAEAEIAFTVADAHQGKGLGSVLLEHLAAIARENGIHRFKAEVLSVNKNMLATFTAAGYSPSQTVNEGVVNLDFDIDPTAKTRLISRAREHRAEALSVRKMASPEHVVVMCDDISQGSPGEMLVANLVAASFVGRLWVVNPSGLGVHGVPGCVTLADVRDEVDMVVMALPPDQAEAAVPRCAEVGVLGIVFVTGGYRAGEGLERQPEIISAIRESGMRIIGPNALGLINTDPRVRLNASLVPQMPGRGRIGLFCQSAAFGAALLREVANRG
ncbi:MAG: GNAT family N-acetyltransferase, partial [Actinomycetes bacterium]